MKKLRLTRSKRHIQGHMAGECPSRDWSPTPSSPWPTAPRGVSWRCEPPACAALCSGPAPAATACLGSTQPPRSPCWRDPAVAPHGAGDAGLGVRPAAHLLGEPVTRRWALTSTDPERGADQHSGRVGVTSPGSKLRTRGNSGVRA